MPQVLKAAVRDRIEEAALALFADRGVTATSMAQIASAAGTAPGNLYRYYASKEALLEAVLPADLPARHDALLDSRITALAAGEADSAAAAELLDFWLAQRLAVVVLLDRAEGTPFAGYPQAFVDRLSAHALASLESPTADHELVLRLVLDNTRRALAHLLRAGGDRERTAALVRAFWSYQVPGLDGLVAHLTEGVRPSAHR